MSVPLANAKLRVAFPDEWRSLIPGDQHTAYADVILKNQFEPLVTVTRQGGFEPLAAKSWSSSSDGRSLSFEIDTSRRFSDGTHLAARHFKEAWEHALATKPSSSNNSALDVLYNVVGYREFKRTGKISGVEAISDSALKVTLERPMRTALEYLTGGRYAAYLIRDGKYLGTGQYVITPVGDRRAELVQNPYFHDRAGFPNVELSVVPAAEARSALDAGLIDVFAYAQNAEIPECGRGAQGKIACLSGDETTHLTISVNGLPGRIFANPHYRLAVQYLISSNTQRATSEEHFRSNPAHFDPQVFVPLQAGRLEENEAIELVRSGAKYVDEFIAATQRSPIYYAGLSGADWVLALLKEKQVGLSQKSGPLPFKDRLHMLYQSSEADLVAGSMSVTSGDPDGLYHALGPAGSIASPMEQRHAVGTLLEEARRIQHVEALHPAYQEVSRAVLRDVPFVHVGFALDLTAYRSDRVQLRHNLKNRNDLPLALFEQVSW